MLFEHHCSCDIFFQYRWYSSAPVFNCQHQRNVILLCTYNAFFRVCLCRPSFLHWHVQAIEPPALSASTYLWWGRTWNMQTPLETLGSGSTVVFELRDVQVRAGGLVGNIVFLILSVVDVYPRERTPLPLATPSQHHHQIREHRCLEQDGWHAPPKSPPPHPCCTSS